MHLVPNVTMTVIPMAAPNDVSGVRQAFESGAIDPSSVVAVIAKSEGSGLFNDQARVFAEQSLRSVIAEARSTSADRIGDDVSFVVSGGTPGVISPHATIVTQEWVEATSSSGTSDGGGLVVGRAFTEDIHPEDIGRGVQLDKVAAAVDRAMAQAGLTDPADVHLVMAKGPALTQRSIDDATQRGVDLVTLDPGIGPMGSMCWSNDAAALGVAVALGEVNRADVPDSAIRSDWSRFSSVALTSAGGEKKRGEVLVFGNRRDSASGIRIGHGLTRDMADLGGVVGALRDAGLAFDVLPTAADQERIVQVFAKFAIPGSDVLRGERITLLDDHESHHLAKCVGGTLVVSVTGKPAAFISGGERNSHMGPPGANPVAAVVRR